MEHNGKVNDSLTFNNKLLHLLYSVQFYEVTTITSCKLDREFKKLSQVTWGPEPAVWEEGRLGG